MNWFTNILRSLLPFRDIGWKEIGEEFTRFTLLGTPWLTVYLHRLNAPNWHPDCHDHPWTFLAILIRKGYLERINGKDFRRRPGSILYRPAETSHNVITPYGTSWSIIITGRKRREWGFQTCASGLQEPAEV